MEAAGDKLMKELRDVVAAAARRSDLIAYGPFADGEYETRAYRLLK